MTVSYMYSRRFLYPALICRLIFFINFNMNMKLDNRLTRLDGVI